MKTVNEYKIKPKANLSSAKLSFAKLSSANLSSADLSSADLSFAKLSSADLRGANLSSAKLSSADLIDADLSFAKLSSAKLSSAKLSSADLPSTDKILICPWSVCNIQRDMIRIGCEYHTTEEWSNFTDEQIDKMDTKALIWWKQNKEIVLFIASKCEPYEK